MTNEITVGRVNARMNRLNKPRQPRMGKIKLGYQVKKCYGCQRKVRLTHAKCPDCGGEKFSKSFPSKTDHFVFIDDVGKDVPSIGHATYGEHPTNLDFTFTANPLDCVEIGYICYQGGKLFCKNRWEPDYRTGDYINRDIAVRAGKEIRCDPLTCPMRVGGNFTMPDGKSRAIDPEHPQCGEKVMMYAWLPKCPGFDAYMIQSGSIASINNVQSAVKKLHGLMQRGYLPLKLQLILKKQHGTYPDQTGKPIKTDFYAFTIHFPFAFADLIEDAKRGQLSDTDIMYKLPTALTRPALPGPRDDVYDELIDGPRGQLVEPKLQPRVTNVTDLTGSEPLPEQAHKLSDIKLKAINETFNTICKITPKSEHGKFKKQFKSTWGLKSLKDIESVSNARADDIIDWLNRKQAQIEETLLDEDEDFFKDKP